MPLKLLHTDLQGSGSGTGMSYYNTAMLCPRKANLDKEYNENRHGTSSSVGTIFHKYMEHYHKDGIKEFAIEEADVALNADLVEANRLFREYTSRHPARYFGRVVGVEKRAPEEGTSLGTIQREALQNLFQIEYTMRADLVVEVGTLDVLHLSKIQGLEEIKPGYYLVDHKTTGKTPSNGVLDYMARPQFPAYMMAWNACFPETPVLGMIANVIVRHKKLTEASFLKFLVPFPSEQRQRGVKNYLNYAAVRAKTDEINLGACSTYGLCYHFTTGACTQE